MGNAGGRNGADDNRVSCVWFGRCRKALRTGERPLLDAAGDFFDVSV